MISFSSCLHFLLSVYFVSFFLLLSSLTFSVCLSILSCILFFFSLKQVRNTLKQQLYNSADQFSSLSKQSTWLLFISNDRETRSSDVELSLCINWSWKKNLLPAFNSSSNNLELIFTVFSHHSNQKILPQVLTQDLNHEASYLGAVWVSRTWLPSTLLISSGKNIETMKINIKEE